MAGEKEILDAGANSVVYKDVIDGRDVVVKTSRNHDDVWLFCAHKENKMLAMLKDQKQNLAADIPEMRLEQENGETRIIQTAVKGDFLTRETYLSCSAEQQDKIAQDLAEAMFAIHNLDIAEIAKVTNDGYIPGEKPGVKNSERYFRGNYQSLIDSLGKHITPETKSALESFIENQFDALEKVNSHVAPIHNDIRYSNIFYDKETSKVGIIDFGSCEVYDIYHDFASIGLPNSLGFELQEKVIDSYNKLLRENGRDFQLSAETAKAYSVARMIYYADMMDRSEKVRKTLFPESSGNEIVGLEAYLREANVLSGEKEYLSKVRGKLAVLRENREQAENPAAKEAVPAERPETERAAQAPQGMEKALFLRAVSERLAAEKP